MKFNTLIALCLIAGIVSGCNNSKGGEGIVDTDGDTWLDSAEAECGSDPQDGLSYPIDLDLDGVCDILDDDVDGDGYLNEEEVLCGSDPEDYFSVPVDADNDGYCSYVDVDDNDALAGLGSPDQLDPVYFPLPFPPVIPVPVPGTGGFDCDLEFDNQPEPPINCGETGLEFDNVPEAPIPGGDNGLEFDNIPFPPLNTGGVPILPGAQPLPPIGNVGLEFD